MRQVRLKLLQYPLHALQDEIPFAAPARLSEHREPGRPRYRLGDAGREIEGLVPGQEYPRPRFDRIGVGNVSHR